MREPLVVVDVKHTVAHPLAGVWATFAALPHVQRTNTDDRLRWTLSDRWIELAVEGINDEWRGSPIHCSCTFGDVVWMWLSVGRHHRAMMLRNALGRLFTPRSFLHEIALPRLSEAFNSTDASARHRAEHELKVYRLVGRDALR